MAARRGGGRVSAVLLLISVGALAATYFMIIGRNPLPAAMNWLSKLGTLSSPAPEWKTRAEQQPSAAAFAGGAVIVLMPGTVQALDSRTGQVMWSRDAAWAALAGGVDAGAGVVVAGRQGRHGFDVIDPATGAVRWSDGAATAAWTYRDLVLAAACSAASCTLVAHEPAYGTVRWRRALAAGDRTPSGANPRLAGLRPLSTAPIDSTAVAPAAAPSVIGLPVNGGVQVVSLASGRLLGRYPTGAGTRVVVAGDRVLRITTATRPGGCRYAVSAIDPITGGQVWHRDGFDLGTADPLGCTARQDPVGAAGLIAAIDPTGSPVLLDAATGAVLITAAANETVLATDGTVAVLRTADNRAIRAVDLRGGNQLWRLAAGRNTGISAGPYGVIIVDPDATRIRVLDPATGATRLDASTAATVLGGDRAELVIGLGRTVGLLPQAA